LTSPCFRNEQDQSNPNHFAKKDRKTKGLPMDMSKGEVEAYLRQAQGQNTEAAFLKRTNSKRINH